MLGSSDWKMKKQIKSFSYPLSCTCIMFHFIHTIPLSQQAKKQMTKKSQ